MKRRYERLAALVSGIFVACGASTPQTHDVTPKTPVVDESIGAVAVATGGLPSLSKSPSARSGGTATALRAALVDPQAKVVLDGVLDDWPARIAAVTVVKGSGDALSFAVGIQYDAAHIYVGAEVKDASFFRTTRFGDGEDHASIVLAFPAGSGFVAYDIGLFAGRPGESPGEVRWKGARRGRIPGAKIVEAPAAGGYTFEASIPWSAFAEARTLRVGLRGVVRYYDSDGSAAARNILATSTGDADAPSALPALPTEAEESIQEGLLEPKGLAGKVPKFDLFADVAGDAMKERISVYESFFTVCGSAYRGGKEYFFRDVAADILRLEAHELTGRGKSDLVLRRRFTDNGATREWFEVWSFLAGDEPTTTFAHEVSIARDGKRVDNAVRIARREIDVTVEPSSTFAPSAYAEPKAADVDPLLLPWAGVKAQTYRFDGSRFKKTKEVAQAVTAVAAQGTAQPEAASAPLSAEEPTTPLVQPSGDLSAHVFEQYRKDHAVASTQRPKVDLTVNVDADPKPERVVLIGRDIVVFGPGFNGGNTYGVLTLTQFQSPDDVHDLVARDLTGDGAADLIVRGTRHVANAGAPDVAIEAMFVYQVKGGQITRIFGIETARSQREKRVQGLVQFVPAKDNRTFDIDVRPGRATGWNATSFPWAQEAPGSGALEPLLLPWGGIHALRYTWDGAAFRVNR